MVVAPWLIIEQRLPAFPLLLFSTEGFSHQKSHADSLDFNPVWHTFFTRKSESQQENHSSPGMKECTDVSFFKQD
jgi:hypothetical protein